MKKTWWIALGICSGTLAAAACFPAHKANLDYVRSATALKVMKEVGEPGVVFQVTAQAAEKRSVSLVSGRAIQLRRSETGPLTQTRTVFSFSGKTKSYCMEIEPGCLEIDRGPLSELSLGSGRDVGMAPLTSCNDSCIKSRMDGGWRLPRSPAAV